MRPGVGVGGLGGQGFYLHFPGPLLLPIGFLLPCRCPVRLAASRFRLVMAVGILFVQLSSRRVWLLLPVVLPRGDGCAVHRGGSPAS